MKIIFTAYVNKVNEIDKDNKFNKVKGYFARRAERSSAPGQDKERQPRGKRWEMGGGTRDEAKATKRKEQGTGTQNEDQDKPCLHQAAISPVTIKIIGYLDWKTTGRAGCLRIVVCIH